MALTTSRYRMISGAPASVLDFGALGDGSTDDTAAFLAAIASGADEIRVPRGTYILTGTLTLPDGVRLVGEGQGWEFSHPTSLLFQGTGTASRTIAGCGTHSVANPAAGTAYLADSGTRGDSYKLLDLTVAFSVGIILSKGSGLANLGIFPNFSGVSGYAGTDGALSDDWDVGVWSRNADHCTIDRCVVAGHWRLAALLHTASDIDDGRTPANERGRYTHNHFQGFRGIAIRTPDPVDGTNWGLASTLFEACFVRGLSHQSAHLATSSELDTPFASPSGCLEISGGTMRGVKFRNCTFHARDDFLLYHHNGGETYFHGCYFEAKSVKVSGDWLADSDGSRMIATSGCSSVYFAEQTKFGADFDPYYTRESNVGRYDPGDAGVFSPAKADDSEYARTVFSTVIGPRLRPGQDWVVFDSENDHVIDLTQTGALTITNTTSTVETLRTTTAGDLVIGNANFRGLADSLNLQRTVAGVSTYVIRCYSSGNIEAWGLLRPEGDNTRSLGDSTHRWSNVYGTNFRPGAGTAIWTSGTGTPEGAVTAPVGSLFTRLDGSTSTTLYVKTSGSGNTGWTAK
jgi:hypothetical protein